MAGTKLTLPGQTTEPSQTVLCSRTNSPPVPTQLQSKGVRRRPSFKYRIDSSEDFPSSHDSIFHAEYISNCGSSEDSSHKPEIRSMVVVNSVPGRASSLSQSRNYENKGDQLLSPTPGNTPIIYGHGTALKTIVEQKSTATMRATTSVEIPILPMSPFTLLGHRNSFDLPSTVTIRSPRRHKSFSADDLVFIKRSYHEACKNIERSKFRHLSVHENYAGPQAPLVPPIERPATPPGMPSWTAAQIGRGQLVLPQQEFASRGSQNRLLRFLHIQPSTGEFRSHTQTPDGLRTLGREFHRRRGARSTSSPMPFRAAPRFRPPRSGHGVGLLETHPFLRVGRVETKSETNPAILRMSLPPNAQPLQAGFAYPPSRAAAKGYRKPTKRGYSPFLLSNSEQRRPKRCPHRRGRLATLRSLNQPIEAVIASPLLQPNNSSRTPAQQEPLICLSPIIQPRFGSLAQAQAQASSTVPDQPLMSGGLVSPTVNPRVATQNTDMMPHKIYPHHRNRCWKCRTATALERMDDIWEASTSWCCWIFCGVNVDECDSDCRAPNHQACRQIRMAPRRVSLAGVPAVVF